MALVVEFCGLPGSGKSVLATHTCAALRRSGVEALVADLPVSAAASRSARVRRKVVAAAAVAAIEPVATTRAARAVAGSRPTPRDGLGLLAQWLTVRRLQRAARSAPGVWLIEEGTVQTFWSLALRAPAHGVDLSRLLTSGAPDLLVIVDAPLDVLLRRLDDRPSRHSRTQRLAADRRGAELERGRLLLDRLVDTIPCGRLTVASDGSVPVEELGRHVAGWVLRVP